MEYIGLEVEPYIGPTEALEILTGHSEERSREADLVVKVVINIIIKKYRIVNQFHTLSQIISYI